MLIPPAAASTARDHEFLANDREIVDRLSGVLVVDNRSYRDREFDMLGIAALFVAAFAMAAAIGLMLGIEAEVQQRVVVGRSNHVYIASATAVAAAGTATGHELFTAERENAVAAVAGLHKDSNFINKHRGYSAKGAERTLQRIRNSIARHSVLRDSSGDTRNGSCFDTTKQLPF
jgi:hypothetical protein